MDAASKNTAPEKRCKWCRKKVVIETLDCVKCGANFHPSCAAQAKVFKAGIVNCCVKTEKSEVMAGKTSEKSENFTDINEKRLRNIIKESIEQYFKPVDQKLDKKFQEIENSMHFMSKSFEEQKETFKEVLDEVKLLRKDNLLLKQRLQQLEVKVDDMEVMEKSKNLIVAGVPKQSFQDERKIANKIFSSMGLNISPNRIIESKRMRNEDGPIIIRLENTETRNEILYKIRQLKGITTKKCKLDGEERKIYLNEDLPIKRRELFKKTRELKKARGFKAAFCRNGVIYLKVNEQDRPIKIKHENDLPK